MAGQALISLSPRLLKGSLLRVGITGGIGSGKSLLARIFTNLGVPLYDADSRAKHLMVEAGALKNQIIDAFGHEAYADGQLNRRHLAQAFQQENMRQKLNALVHPAVEADFEVWAELPHQAPYLLKEAALLFEAGSYKRLDVMVSVACPAEERMARVQQRDPQRTEAEIRGIINSQLTDEERSSRSDVTLYNGDPDQVLTQVLELHEALVTLSLTRGLENASA